MMTKKEKGRMGEEETEKSLNVKQSQKRPKVIIRKCKKTPTPNAADESKKVNGEVSSDKKGNENDVLKVVEESKPKENICTQVYTRSLKRKISEILDNSASLEEDDIAQNKNDGGNEKTPEGFKKRIVVRTGNKKVGPNLADQASSDSPKEDSIQNSPKSNNKSKVVKISKVKKKNVAGGVKSADGDGDDNQAESQAEYAQYLGLQPTMQFKCYRCGEKGFPSMLALNMHQRGCGVTQKSNFIANLQQDTSITPDPNMLTNFRITRKVYLCSACGTYYENWNLFLHMRDVHKKHICLFCLTMFTMADKLADHLQNAHNVQESTYESSEEFQNAYKGSCYLICCTCENMFTERENYFHHKCIKRGDPTAKCNLCGVKCGHYYTCPNSNIPKTIPASTAVNQVTSVSKTQTAVLPKIIKQNSKNKPEQPWMGMKKGVASLENDDDYDISHAASFCHVDITDESLEKDKEKDQIDSVILGSSDSQKPGNSIGEGTIVNLIGNTKNDKQDHEKEISEKSQMSVDESDITILEDPSNDQSHEDDDKSKECQDISQSTDGNESPLKEPKITSDTESRNDVAGDQSVEERDEPNSKTDYVVKDISISLDKETDVSLSESNDKLDASPSQEEENASEQPQSCEIPPQEDSNALEKVEPPPNNDNHSTSSDTDGDHVVNQSGSQGDSESSSDDSSDEDHKKDNSKQSLDSTKEDTISETGSEKSGLVVDDKSNTNNSPDDSKNLTNDNLTEDGNISDAKSNESNKPSEECNLENVPSTIENPTTPENGSIDSAKADLSKYSPNAVGDGILLAGDDVPAMALTLEDKLEEASPQSVVKECVRTSCQNCVYCCHAIKIAVNGKQLALHLLAEHRYKPVKNNETCEDVIGKLKSSLSTLESLFFNTESYDSSDKSLNSSYDYNYECFQCRFVTKVHKELYVHKRKMHQKTVLLCVMCKSNFYSYSELLCHMCPGIYVSEDINFRCCFCNVDMIPSAFRLMVHMRKSHHTCDICLEVAGDQQRLSTHMWKHKLNHLCYRCGIAYRNKPDITKHLFWKHGTESVLCKKCLQKKWPHVYHFCIPPTVFICEECNASFSKAVALKVHKRIHGGELPYKCPICDKKFVSKKLLGKHENIHIEPNPLDKSTVNSQQENKENDSLNEDINVESIDEPGDESTKKDVTTKDIVNNDDVKSDGMPQLKSKKKKKRDKEAKDKPVVDVYDLPPLNLSSDSDSSDNDSKPSEPNLEKPDIQEENTPDQPLVDDSKPENQITESAESHEGNKTPVQIVDGVWDNFHTYRAELEKRESKDLSLPNILPSTSSTPLTQDKVAEIRQDNAVAEIRQDKSVAEISQDKAVAEEELSSWFLMDHSYCLNPSKPKSPEDEDVGEQKAPEALEAPPKVVENNSEEIPAPRGHSSSIDHAYATPNNSNTDGGIALLVPSEQSLTEEIPKTPPPLSDPPAELHSSSKKKQKTPKKKKHTSNSSSSSDSSSDSENSSCSCKSTCSCTSHSSSSSSSSSSDSDSSTSEGRRRAAARKERKKERVKDKTTKEEQSALPGESRMQPTPTEEEPVVDLPAESLEIPIRESDLDTDESSTDEDFYDKYPQSHAKQQMEKRNKLMLLASVAPVNNGTVSPPLPPPVENPPPPPPTAKRKIKTKKRRKSQQTKKTVNKSALLQQILPSTSVNVVASSPNQPHLPSNHLNFSTKIASPVRNPATHLHSDTTAGSGSENESARLSKRKRVRNKFYGYSSDEEYLEKATPKWRKVESSTVSQPATPIMNFQTTLTLQRPHLIPSQTRRPKIIVPEPPESSGSDEEITKKEDSSNSSSSSSDSEHEIDSKVNIQKEQTEKSDNLYCYCQCPYDEVSEMIACDGQDCTIEWFHFECVGIMVPPKGKWYCPDCRKRRELM